MFRRWGSAVTPISVLLNVCVVSGIGIICEGLAYLYKDASRTADLYLVLFALIFLSISRLSVTLPSGATWRPGIPMITSSMFLLPPSLTTLVAIPGLILITAAGKRHWYSYMVTFAHVALGLYTGAGIYRLLLGSLTGSAFVKITIAGVFALVVHLVVNRLLSAVIVAHHRSRLLTEQLHLVVRELHWGYFTSYLVSIMTAILCAKYGWLSLLLGMTVQIGLYKSVAYYRLLQESEQRYRSFNERNPDGICSFDLIGNFVGTNPAFERLLGYSFEELQQMRYTDLLLEEDKEQAKSLFSQMLRGELQEDMELVVRHKHGHTVEVSFTNVPMVINGKLTGLYALVKDMTAKKQADAYIRKYEKLTTVGQLAAGVAHEIRNPLTALKGFAKLLDSSATDSQKPYLGIMQDELNRIERIVGELLVLGKPQATNFKWVDVTHSLRDVVMLLDTLATMNNVQITTYFEEDAPMVNCEENQLKQVFINVAKNGIEAMPHGGNLTIRLKSTREALWIEIEDEGVGIPDEQLSMIGEPFHTTKAKGTGLGLMVSQKIISVHNGEMDISSQLGKGTTVRIKLPTASTAVPTA